MLLTNKAKINLINFKSGNKQEFTAVLQKFLAIYANMGRRKAGFRRFHKQNSNVLLSIKLVFFCF